MKIGAEMWHYRMARDISYYYYHECVHTLLYPNAYTLMLRVFIQYAVIEGDQGRACPRGQPTVESLCCCGHGLSRRTPTLVVVEIRQFYIQCVCFNLIPFISCEKISYVMVKSVESMETDNCDIFFFIEHHQIPMFVS